MTGRFEYVAALIPSKQDCANFFAPMQPSLPKRGSETEENEKVPFFLVKRIREAILDEVFQPGDRLLEVDLAEKFEVSRQPVREALLALEKEGTAKVRPPIPRPLYARARLESRRIASSKSRSASS